MKYKTVREARFLDRPNRFVAHVEIDGREEIVNVKNTNRTLRPKGSLHIRKSLFH